MSDQNWAELAESSRQALALMGYTIAPRCLPGEPEACGATYAQHFAAHLAAMRAVIDHHTIHLGPGFADPIGAPVYTAVAADLARDCVDSHA